jgi:hypothetical protein
MWNEKLSWSCRRWGMESLAEVVENSPDHIIPAIIDGFRTPPVPIQKSMFTKSCASFCHPCLRASIWFLGCVQRFAGASSSSLRQFFGSTNLSMKEQHHLMCMEKWRGSQERCSHYWTRFGRILPLTTGTEYRSKYVLQWAHMLSWHRHTHAGGYRCIL